MKKIFLVLALLFLIMPLVASAAVLKAGQSYTLSKDQTIAKNLYTAGNNVNLLGAAKEDVFVAGGTVIISGTVGKDLVAAGGTLIIDGNVGEDARIAGGNLTIGGKIGGELLVAGGQLNLSPDLEIKGDATLAGGNLLIDGNIGGDLSAYGGEVRIDGKIKGNVQVKTNRKLIIGSQAEISGNLDYSAPEKLTIEDGAKIKGKVTFNELQTLKAQKAKKGLFGIWGLSWLLGLVIFLTAALVINFLLRKKLEEVVGYTLANFGKETLRGFVILVVLPIAVIISFVTVIGALLGGAGLLIYILMGLLASIFAPIVLGSLIFRKLLKKPEFGADWRSVVVGVAVMRIAQVIPYVGWILWFIFFLAAFGALFNYLYRHFRKV